MEQSSGHTKNKKWNLFVSGGYFDYQTFFITLLIIAFGTMMVYSSSGFAEVLYGYEKGYYMSRQLLFAFAGIVIMIGVSHVNYRFYEVAASAFMMIILPVLLLVALSGSDANGSTRWLAIGGVSIQPSEFAKPVIAIYMSMQCTRYKSYLNDLKKIARLCFWPLVAIVIIAIENLSTAIICFAIMGVILFVCLPDLKHLIAPAAVGVIGVIIAIVARGYRSGRISGWLNSDVADMPYQTKHSLYAIGSGGLFGKGLGESMQKLGFLPEAHTDMIFSIICEELGLFGALGVIALFVLLLINIRRIANNSSDRFGGLLATGILAHIATQSLINLAVATNTIPNTGVPLPFISYGGTALICLSIEMGIILGISRMAQPIKK